MNKLRLPKRINAVEKDMFGQPLPPQPGHLVTPDKPVSYREIDWPTVASMGADFVPVVGDVKSGIEAIRGKDPITNEQMSWWQRALAGVGTLPLIPNIGLEIKAFHGSPHKFNKFSMSKVGSGEGAQAFGHGLYFTSEKDIAKYYAKMGLKDVNREADALTIAFQNASKEQLSQIGKYVPKLKDTVNPEFWSYTDILDSLEDVNRFSGKSSDIDALKRWAQDSKLWQGPSENLYSVTLHKGKKPGEYDYLKWDEPVPENVYKKIGVSVKPGGKGRVILDGGPFSQRTVADDTGQGLYRALANVVGKKQIGQNKFYNEYSPKEASLFLLRAGIDGIEYPAGTLSGVKSSKAKNYVVFDENAITIEEPKLIPPKEIKAK